MHKRRTGETVTEEGMYICEDGCERRYYRPGEQAGTCCIRSTETTWLKVEEQ